MEGQLRLRNAKVLVVGAGGLGCPTVMFLAAAGVGKIGVVDGDTIERGNLHRQVLHKESLVGTSKAVSIAMFVRRRSTLAAPRGERSMWVAPREGASPGSLHAGVADLFNTDVRSILMVLLASHNRYTVSQ